MASIIAALILVLAIPLNPDIIPEFTVSAASYTEDVVTSWNISLAA